MYKSMGGFIVSTFIIFVMLSLLFIALGVLIKYFKCYWLISGYNTSSKEERERVDIASLGKLVGNFCFFLGAMFLVIGILSLSGFDSAAIITYPMIFISVIYLILKSQKYDSNPKSSRTSKIAALLLGSFFIITFGLILYSARETRVIVTPQSINIEGTYGINLDMNKINEIELKDSMPRIYAKANGFNFGRVLKGNFDLDEFGTCKIYIYKGKPPYIHIKYGDEHIILNQKDESRTKKLYDDMLKQWKIHKY